MPWVIVGVDSSVPWPTTDTEVEFCGHSVTLRPATDDLMPTIAFEYAGGMSHEEALVFVRRFMSSLAWVERGAVREEVVTGGSHPIGVGWSHKGGIITHSFRQDYLPAPEDRRVRLALALYREALGLNSVAYSFLGFFKIVNLLKKTGAEQKAWINAVIQELGEYRAVERRKELEADEPDIGAYLYESGRCAVAHAYADPIVDPEDAEDRSRLTRDLPLIQALAEYAIENELGVKTRDTVWREHLYQLDGFRNILGAEAVEKLKKKEYDDFPTISLPKLSIRVRDQEQLNSFRDLVPEQARVDEGVLWIRCRTESGAMETAVGLDLPNELLLFDPENGVSVRAGADYATISARIDWLQLLKDLLSNGSLEVYSADDGLLLGRTDPYIATNIDLNGSISNIDRSIEGLRAIQAEIKE